MTGERWLQWQGNSAEAIKTIADERMTLPMRLPRRRESDRNFENRSKVPGGAGADTGSITQATDVFHVTARGDDHIW
jgi:hypothetical protein